MATAQRSTTDVPIWTPDEGAPVWASARGELVRTIDGAELVDLSMGWGACLWGHGLVTERIIEHFSPFELAQGVGSTQTTAIRQRAEGELVEWARRVWPGSPELRVGILHTGAEAVEAALKTALAATGRPNVVAFQGAYHGSFGDSVLAISDDATRRAFEPTFRFEAVRHVPYGEVPELDEQVACVIVEPVQGATGVVVPPEGFLAGLRAECDRVGALFVLDDVLVGCGRTGEPIDGIECAPDIVVLAKALGGGMIVSAVLMPTDIAERAWGGDDAPSLSTTYYGHPLSCAAIIEVLALHEQYDLQERCAPIEAALRRIEDRSSLTLRGKGAFWALVGEPGQGSRLATELLGRDVIADAGGSDDEALSLKPSLLIRQHSLDRVVDAVLDCPSAS
jgi:putrescine aminotransferase